MAKGLIVYISDFDLGGSGYMNIGTRLCTELVKTHGYDVIALGYAYDGREHNWPFTIVPVSDLAQIPQMVHLMGTIYGAEIEAVVVALDILMQEYLMQDMTIPNPAYAYIGLFPLEAPPLCQTWAMQLTRMDTCLIMSEFGQDALADAGIESTFIPFGVADTWRPPTAEERRDIRAGLGIEEDDFVILTVADNQERKNLSRAAEIVSGFSVEIESRTTSGIATTTRSLRKTKWFLVTRPDSPMGWKLDGLMLNLGIFDRTSIFPRGMPEKNLWALYAAADMFLLTSKAEGLAIPVMEAMASRIPVVATDCTAMREHLEGGRGFLIDVDYQYIDPYGNEYRYFVSVENGVKILDGIADLPFISDELSAMLDSAQTYINGRTWQQAGNIMAKAIAGAIEVRNQQKIQTTGDLPHGETETTPAIAKKSVTVG